MKAGDISALLVSVFTKFTSSWKPMMPFPMSLGDGEQLLAMGVVHTSMSARQATSAMVGRDAVLRPHHSELDFWVEVRLREFDGRWLTVADLAAEPDVGTGMGP